MSYSYDVNARYPVMIRVYIDDGEIVEHCARSFRAAQGWLAHCMDAGYFFGLPERVEYKFYKGYRRE